MVRGAVSGADLEAVRGGERGRHIGLGGAHRLGQTEPLGEAGSDRVGLRAQRCRTPIARFAKLSRSAITVII